MATKVGRNPTQHRGIETIRSKPHQTTSGRQRLLIIALRAARAHSAEVKDLHLRLSPVVVFARLHDM